MHRSLIVIAFLGCLATDPSLMAGDPIALPTIQATVEPMPGWTPTSEGVLTSLVGMVTRGVVAHAKAKKIVLRPGEVEVRLLAMWSNRHPKGDNPNIILQTERIWGDPAGKTGRDFIDLITERCALFAKHNQRQGEIREEKSGDLVFYSADFENRLFPEMVTRQEYVATVRGNQYVVFVLSYNDKTDADYRAMRAFVASFKPAP